MIKGLSLILDFLFPCYCVSCRIPVSSGSNHLCSSCFKSLKPAVGGCPVCSVILQGGSCVFCSSRRFYPERHISLFDYDGTAKRIIHALKFSGIRDVYRVLVPFMSDRVKDFGRPVDMITYVPMSRKKHAERGYNQSALMATALSETTGIPVYELLREKGSSIAQRDFSYAGRFINVIDRYETIRKSYFKNRVILLIDDVFTTGATVNECSRQLLASGAAGVFSLTLARSDLKKLENI